MNKKVIVFLILIITLNLAGTTLVLAQTPEPSYAPVAGSQLCSGIADCSYDKLVGKGGLVDRIIGFLLFDLAIPIAVICFAIAGIMLVTKPGVPDARGKAKKIIWSAVIGFVIALAAYLIVQAIISGLSPSSYSNGANGSGNFLQNIFNH